MLGETKTANSLFSVKVNGPWFLARAEPQNRLEVDMALFRNVHA